MVSTNEKSISFIIITSDEPWSEIWHTQLHYANQLSRQTQVIFLGPPKPWNFQNLFQFKQKSTVISKSLTVVNYLNCLPSGLGKLSLWFNDKLNAVLIKKRFLKNSYTGKGVIWHFDRYRSFYLFRNHKNVQHIYHVIDPCTNLNLDVKLSRTSDLVVVTSPKFIDHYNGLNNKVLQIGQGVDSEFLSEKTTNENNSDLVSYNSILLLGTLSDDIDFDFLITLKEKLPANLCLIGPDKLKRESSKKKFADLLSLENVFWLGPMPPDLFRKHVQACKVGIIAYQIKGMEWNTLRSPLKVIGFMAMKKPVVSNIDCEIPSLMEKAIYLRESQDDYIATIEKIYDGKIIVDENKVNEFLGSINYDKLISQILTKLYT